MPRKMSAKRAIDRFIEYHRRPFKVSDVAHDTGVHPKTVRNLMPQFVEEGRVRVLLKEKDGNIYVKVPVALRRPKRTHDWVPRMEKLQHFYDIVELQPSLDEIRKHSPFSRESVYRYLRILVIDGCLKKIGNMYKQVEFKPTLRPWSDYKGTSQEPGKTRQTERDQIIRDIHQYCNRSDLKLPDFDEQTPVDQLQSIRSRCFYKSYGMGGYDPR